MCRLRTLNHLAVVFIVLSLVLQACQPGNFQPTPTIATIEATHTPTVTASPTQTSTPIPDLQPATVTVNPTATPTQDLSQLLDQALIEGVDWNVGIESMNGERLYERRPNESFFPASMIKIPIAMVTLIILENRGETVETIQQYGIGRSFSALLEGMIVRSEEAATETLETFANGNNRLRGYLDWWGLEDTFFYPRRTTVENLLLALKLINTGEVLNEEFNSYLLGQMGEYTENDETLLGVMLDSLSDCSFYNKRGTMTDPMVVSDMGILACGDNAWYLVIAGTPAADSSVNYEDIQASIEQFGRDFALYLNQVIFR